MWGLTGRWWIQSHPIPVDYTTMMMRALVTLNMNKQDLDKVISRSQNQNSKEGQSVSLRWNYISRFPLSAKTTQPSAVHQPEAERDHSGEQLSSVPAFSTPAYPVQGSGVLDISQHALGKKQGNTSGRSGFLNYVKMRVIKCCDESRAI